MSTLAKFVDPDEYEQILNLVRSDSADESYIIVGHKDGALNELEILRIGTDTSELADLMDDAQILYIFARYITTYDASKTVKFVFIHWIGDDIPFVKKGRFGVVLGSVQEYFNPCHLVIETNNRDELEDGYVFQKLGDYDGTTSKVLDSIEGRQERGFTQTQVPQRGGKNIGLANVAKESEEIEISTAVFEDVEAVRSDTDSLSWVLACYRDGNPNGPIDSYAKGDGGLDEMREHLQDDLPMYAFLRYSDNVDGITTVKFVYIVWVGCDVKSTIKAKTSTHKGRAEAVFMPAHVTIFANDESDVSDSSVSAKVRAK